MDLEQLMTFSNGAIFGGLMGIYLGARLAKNIPGKGNNVIAVIPLNGNISSNESPKNISPKRVIKTLEKICKSKKTKGIIFDINSGGGAVYASREIAGYIQNIKIPKVALARDICASGAYMIACATDAIIAMEESAIGSIGVITAHFAAGNLLDKLGIKYNVTKAGRNKDAHMPLDELNDEQEAIMQAQIDEIYESFIDYVYARRNDSWKRTDRNAPARDEIKSLATGDIYLGKQAYNSGLIDAIGSMNEAVMAVEYLGGFKKTGIYVVEEKPSFASMLGLKFGSALGKSVAEEIKNELYTETKTNY